MAVFGIKPDKPENKIQLNKSIINPSYVSKDKAKAFELDAVNMKTRNNRKS